jgi:hypothetical protein
MGMTHPPFGEKIPFLRRFVKASDNATLSDIFGSRQVRRFGGQDLAKSAGME